MPSIVPGYEYDIFISYRQNDNRSGWVTEFVNYLNEELAATIKEPVSLYFDSNLHDGLLETHNVDKSLERKLKCLIFVPIISQTYCDPKSFAWQHEFCAFNRLAKGDQLGRDVKLANGNVAGRILSIKIHNLGAEDKAVIENEIGGVLRAIEFIYSEPGVNRPLKPNDTKTDNQNKLDYRNQVNKVANAIKEIVAAVSSDSNAQVQQLKSKPINQLGTNRKKKLVMAAIVLVAFAAIGFLFFYKSPLSNNGKSVAVLPFKTLSNDPDQKYFTFGIMEDVISRLYKISDLHVTSSTSALAFQNSDKNVRQIAKELGVAYVLEGSVQKDGDEVKISVRLVDAANDENIWADVFNYKMSNAFTLQAELAERVANGLEIRLTQTEKEQINKTGTRSNLAFEYYQKGKFYNEFSGRDNLEKSRHFFLKAIETDSTYAAAYAGVAEVDISTIDWGYSNPIQASDGILSNIRKAIRLDSLLGEAYSALGAYHIYCTKEYDQAEKAFQRGIKLNPGYDFTYFHYSVLQVIRKNQKKSLELIQRAISLNPLSIKFNVYKVQMDYYMFREYDQAQKELDRIFRIFPNDNFALWVQGTIYSEQGRYEEAEQAYLKRTVPTKHLNWALAYCYAKAGKSEKAKKILAYLLDKEKQVYMMPTQIASIYLGLGDEKNAWVYLTKASSVNDYWLIYYGLDPWLDPVRSDARFKKILRKANLSN